MRKALYRKYRSISLDDIVGQEPIVTALRNALKTDRISHAYLFTGPRGVGKTSIARILAHEINQIPYTNEDHNVDIIEIDGASNRGVDEIRDLREKVSIAPSISKYKIYIIDEVHMLTTYAFNALLKTLEEPPSHVIFILATTNLEKLPLTIISRTQRYNFQSLPYDKVEQHLRKITQQEKIDITDDALTMIAKYGGGSLRDSISALDQVSNQGDKINAQIVAKTIGWPPLDIIRELLDKILNQTISISEIFNNLDDLYNQGYQSSAIANQMIDLLKERLIDNKTNKLSSKQMLKLLKNLIQVEAVYNPERYLEIILIDLVQDQIILTNPGVQQSDIAEKIPANNFKEVKTNSTDTVVNIIKNNDINEIWTELLNQLRISHNTLYGIIRMSQPTLKSDNSIELIFKFSFHQKRLKEAKNNKIITDILYAITGQIYNVIYIIDNDQSSKTRTMKKDDIIENSKDDNISTITEIFKGAKIID